jgi:hypothetical protein
MTFFPPFPFPSFPLPSRSAAHSAEIDDALWHFDDTQLADLGHAGSRIMRRADAANGLGAPPLGIDMSSLPSLEAALYYEIGLASDIERGGGSSATGASATVGSLVLRPNPAVANSYLQSALGICRSLSMARPHHHVTNAEVNRTPLHRVHIHTSCDALVHSLYTSVYTPLVLTPIRLFVAGLVNGWRLAIPGRRSIAVPQAFAQGRAGSRSIAVVGRVSGF